MNFKKNFKFISLILFSGILLSACTNKYSDQNLDMSQNTPVTPAENNILNISSNPINPNINENMASIKTKDGEIIVKLYSQETPNTVANFINKVDSNFYQNLTFHRVIPGFMAQGGDPTGTGSGGGKQKSELNNIPFVRGSLGLARTAETNQISNDSQFFICFTTEGCQHLTGDYVNFGEVVSGLDILDKIQQGDKIIDITTKTK
ncbi:MAG: peptidylprolyl isomerase [Candidatus Shapirobacteria bacterium]